MSMRRFLIRIAALLAGAAILHPVYIRSAVASPAPGGRPTSHPSTAIMTIHGARLTLHLLGSAYPLNALVLATVHLTNLTSRDIWPPAAVDPPDA